MLYFVFVFAYYIQHIAVVCMFVLEWRFIKSAEDTFSIVYFCNNKFNAKLNVICSLYACRLHATHDCCMYMHTRAMFGILWCHIGYRNMAWNLFLGTLYSQGAHSLMWKVDLTVLFPYNNIYSSISSLDGIILFLFILHLFICLYLQMSEHLLFFFVCCMHRNYFSVHQSVCPSFCLSRWCKCYTCI